MSVSGGSSSFLATLPFSAFALLVAGSSSGRSGSRFLSLLHSSPLSLTGGSTTSPLASIVATTGGSDHCSGLVPATADLECINTDERAVCELWCWSVFFLLWIVSYCCSPCRLFSLPMKFSFSICLPSMTGGFWHYEVPTSTLVLYRKDGPCRGVWGVPCIAADQALRWCSCHLTGRRQMRWNGQFPAES